MLTNVLKQGQLLTVAVQEIRNLQKQVEKMGKKKSLETVTLGVETNKVRTVHVPVVLDIESRPVKVQAQTTVCDKASSAVVDAKQHHYGQGNFGKKLEEFKKPLPPSKKKRHN